MTVACTQSGELVALDPAVIEAFASRLTERVLVESTAEYEQVRRVWNGLIDKRPAFVVRCAGGGFRLLEPRQANHGSCGSREMTPARQP